MLAHLLQWYACEADPLPSATPPPPALTPPRPRAAALPIPLPCTRPPVYSGARVKPSAAQIA